MGGAPWRTRGDKLPQPWCRIEGARSKAGDSRSIVEAVAPRNCIIDGEAVACDDNGVSDFDRLRYRRDDPAVSLQAFNLIELDGEDLRREPRKVTLSAF